MRSEEMKRNKNEEMLEIRKIVEKVRQRQTNAGWYYYLFVELKISQTRRNSRKVKSPCRGVGEVGRGW